MSHDLPALIANLRPYVLQAGDAIMEIHSQLTPQDVQSKGDGSPVTQADLAAERILLRGLRTHAANIPIVSEENAQSHLQTVASEFFLVDPLDGTREFIKTDGSGAFTVNIGLIQANEPVAGIVYAPALGDYYAGVKDVGATLNNIAISSRPMAEDLVAVASRSHRDPETDQWLEKNRISHTRSIGSSLKFGLIARGEADVYPRYGPTMEWDTAAGDAVLRASGGKVLTPEGQPFCYGKPGYANGAFIAWGASAQ